MSKAYSLVWYTLKEYMVFDTEIALGSKSFDTREECMAFINGRHGLYFIMCDDMGNELHHFSIVRKSLDELLFLERVFKTLEDE